MTTEGEQQEAVCGTCGKADDAECATCRTQIHDIYRPAFCLADHHWPTIPAPVVPSDDERPTLVYLASPYSDPDPAVMERRFEAVCREAAVLMARGIHIYSPIAHTHPIAVRGDLPKDWTFWEAYDRVMLGASSELWVLTLDGYEGSRGVAAEVNIATEMGKPVRYIAPEAAAPPTPSQDAEGDRWRPKCQLCGKRHGPDGGTDIARAWNAVVDHRRTVEHAVFSTLCSDVESAIREPYEALVNARDAIIADLCIRIVDLEDPQGHDAVEHECGAACEHLSDCHLHDGPADERRSCCTCWYRRNDTALAHIEESLGGRKDA